MGLAKLGKKNKFGGKPSTQQRLRGSINSKDNDLRGDEFARLKPIVLKRDNYCCRKCGNSNHPSNPTDIVLTVHHIIAVSKGGKNILSNMITLCSVCHSKVLGKVHQRGAAGLRSMEGNASSSRASGWGDSWRKHE